MNSKKMTNAARSARTGQSTRSCNILRSADTASPCLAAFAAYNRLVKPASAMSCILLITRDRSTEVLAERALVAGGHDVITADSTDAALRSLLNVRVDAAVLDTTVGEEAMSEFCSWLRSTETGCPVVFLASPGARWLGSLPVEPERDEIVVKPCDGKEIRQAVEKTLNSAHHLSPAALMIGDITLDRSSHELRGDGVSVQLTPTEFRLVQYLAQRRGAIVSTEELLEDRKSTRLNSS